MDRFFMAVATGLYTGYLPKAPGTWGSLVALPLYLLLAPLALPWYLLSLLGLLLLGIAAADAAEKILDRSDPGIVVIDEIVGMLVTLAGSPTTLPALAAGFLLFRLFDITKPFPVRLLDQRFHGGLGIMLDDLMAGLYSLLALQLLLRLPLF